MSAYDPVLTDLKALGDELTTIGDESLSAIKAGARHSSRDIELIQNIADAASDILDLAVGLGAADPDAEEDAAEGEEEDADEELDAGDPDALKAAFDDPLAYAAHECGDVMGACAALQTLAQLAMSELGEENPGEGTLAKVTGAMRLLTDYIGKEIDAIGAGGIGVKAAPLFGGKPRDDLKDDDFGDPANRKYPIMTAKDVTAAAALIGKADDPDAVKKKIIAITKRKGFEDALPASWMEGGATKGIEFISDDLAVCPGDSVKALDSGDGLVGGYLVRFGGDGDLSQWRDVFTPDTDYGRHTKTDVWVHHRMLPGIGKQRLANQADIGVDDVGVFIKHLLNLRDPYERSLYGLVQQNKLGWSSGTAPHLVDRKSADGGRHEVRQWILGLDASYTPTPAGGLEVNANAMKSLFDEAGIDLLNVIHAAPDAQKAIELELLAIEMEMLAITEMVA